MVMVLVMMICLEKFLGCLFVRFLDANEYRRA
jgi:hypothetical protein